MEFGVTWLWMMVCLREMALLWVQDPSMIHKLMYGLPSLKRPMLRSMVDTIPSEKQSAEKVIFEI